MPDNYTAFSHIPIEARDGGDPRYIVIWKKLTEDADLTTPEGRFALDNILREFLTTIEPDGLRAHYAAMFRSLRSIELAGGIALPEGIEW